MKASFRLVVTGVLLAMVVGCGGADTDGTVEEEGADVVPAPSTHVAAEAINIGGGCRNGICQVNQWVCSASQTVNGVRECIAWTLVTRDVCC